MLAPVLLATAALFGGTGNPPGFHAFAAINDSRSHGLVGDGLLSLNEAIQLHNNTLLHNQLSPAEQAQVLLIPGTGTSTYLSWARLDGSFTPVITIEQDLDVIVNTTYGLYFSSDNDPTVLDFSGANLTRGMRATTNALQMRDLVFSGGLYGLDVVQTDIAGQIGFAANNCRFENQSQFGVRVSTTTPNGFGKCYLENCVFAGATTGVIFDEAVAGRTSFFDLHNCRITGATNGVDVRLGSGGLGRYSLGRLVIEASDTGIGITRPGGADRQAQLLWRHLDVRALHCVAIACSPVGATTVSMQMLHLWATAAAGSSLVLGLHGDKVAGVVEDSTFDGLLAARTGGGTSPLALRNIRCRNANVSFAASPAQALSIDDSRFDLCAVAAAGTATINFTNCCFPSGLLYGVATSPVVCTDCFVHAANPGQFVTQVSPRPQQQLGSMRVLPDVPTIGSTVTFQADLPTGLFGAFLLGFTEPNPNLLPQPLHVYGMMNATFLLPGIFRFQQTYAWAIPSNPLYIGLDMVAQIAVLPDPNVSALPVQLAPGRRFALQ